MRYRPRFAVTGLVVMILALGTSLAAAQARAHVYLFRGLADVYSLGMNTLADELNARGIAATAYSHTDWKTVANGVAADYKAGKVRPIILVGHSLGADAVMEMADYLGDKGVPVALVVPFDGTQSFPVPGNVGRVINFTQRDYAYMRPGLGFRGSLDNVDLSGDHSIDHFTIDKSPRLHARVISEVLALVGRRNAEPATARGGRTKSIEIAKPPAEPAASATAAPATSHSAATPQSRAPLPKADPAQIPD